jgi:hypothetical protein
MKYVKTFESFNSQDEINEGLKDWVIGGLIALSSIGSINAQNTDGESVTSPTTRTEYQIHQSQLDNNVIKKLTKYHNMVMKHSKDFVKSQDGKYTLTKAANFITSSKPGMGYNKKVVFIGIGDESHPDAQICLTLKDDGVISVCIGDERNEKDGTQPMDQTEIIKSDIGYNLALELVNAL